MNIFLPLLVGGKKAKKKAKPVSLNDFLNTKKPSGYSPAPNWADATEDIDPSGIYGSLFLLWV